MDASESTSPGATKRWANPRLLWITLLVCLGIYVAAGFPIANTGSVISPDCGARLLQVQALHVHWPDWSIPYPAAAIDPQRTNSPLAFYEFNYHGKTHTFYSFLFALISAGLSRLLGPIGMVLLPILCGLLAGAASYGIARRMGLRYPILPLVLVSLFTPILLLGVTFWDPTVTAGIAVLGLYLAIRAIQDREPLWWLAAGMVLGLGYWFHEIILPYLPALVVGGLFIYRRKAVLPMTFLVGGMLLMLIPLALINREVYGTFSGPHLANNRLSSPGEAIKLLIDPTLWGPASFYTLFGWGDSNPGYSWLLKDWLQNSEQMRWEYWVSALMSIPVIGWIILAVSGLWRRRGFWILGLLLFAGMVANGVWILAHKDLPHSLFYVCPLLALAFAARGSRAETAEGAPAEDPERARIWQFMALVTALFALMVLVMPPLGGTEWGSRYLLITVPALILFACRTVEEQLAVALSSRPTRERAPAMALLSGMGALLLITGALQVAGYRKILDIHRWNEQLAKDILNRPERVVVYTVWWAPMNAAPAYPQKMTVYAGDPTHSATGLFARLRLAGIKDYLLVGFNPGDISRYALPLGYVADPRSARPSTYGLWLCEYHLQEQSPRSTTPTDSGVPPSEDLRHRR